MPATIKTDSESSISIDTYKKIQGKYESDYKNDFEWGD